MKHLKEYALNIKNQQRCRIKGGKIILNFNDKTFDLPCEMKKETEPEKNNAI